MTRVLLVLAAIPALTLAQSDSKPAQTPRTTSVDTLLELNRAADAALADYRLDKAEPILEHAVAIATTLGSGEEIKARARLVNLFLDLQKRDGRDWLNLAIPHLLRSIELNKGIPSELGHQLVTQLALAIFQLPGTVQSAGLSPQFSKFMEQWIAQIEKSDGPLAPRAALRYYALSFAAPQSEAWTHAEHACVILGGSSEVPSPDYARILLECADRELQNVAETNALTLARKARQVATLGGPRYAYESVLSYVIEAEAQLRLVNLLGSETALDEATSLARKWLSPRHPIWDRIETARSPASNKQRQLVRRLPANQTVPKDARIRPAVPITQVAPEYTKAARAERFAGKAVAAVLITADGKGELFSIFQNVPYGLNASVEKAIKQWTFQPWTKDGKPVPGMSVVEVNFQLAN